MQYVGSYSSILDRLLSESSLRSYPPLPPRLAPHGRPRPACHGDWGISILYDLAPTPDKPPTPAASLVKTARKSMQSHLSSNFVFDEDYQNEEERNFWCLPFFKALMLATIQEEIILKLRILLECNNSLRVIRILTKLKLLLDLKFEVKEEPCTDPLKLIDRSNLNCNEYKLNKLESDRTDILKVTNDLYVELLEKKCFLKLLDYVNSVLNIEQYAIKIVEDEAKNRIRKKEASRNLRMQRNYHKALLYETANNITNLRSQIEDATLLSETKGRYVDNWQAARTEQHKVIIQEKENSNTKSTEYFKHRTDHETRIHAEVEMLTNIVMNETLKEIENWMNKYETETEQIDLQLKTQKLQWQEAHEERVKMEQELKVHAKQIKDWVKFKDKREKERAYENNMIKSAIIVQAWWRGLLVRKQLGPYKPQPKKGKKAKKK